MRVESGGERTRCYGRRIIDVGHDFRKEEKKKKVGTVHERERVPMDCPYRVEKIGHIFAAGPDWARRTGESAWANVDMNTCEDISRHLNSTGTASAIGCYRKVGTYATT